LTGGRVGGQQNSFDDAALKPAAAFARTRH